MAQDLQRSVIASSHRALAACRGKPAFCGSVACRRSMRRPLTTALLVLGIFYSEPLAGQARLSAADSGRYTGLPLPRFASLRSEPVNLRRGPGLRYPIKWVLHRRGLPVEIVQEFFTWRSVRLSDGTVGWVHQSLLNGRRNFIVQTAAFIRAEAKNGADVIARLEDGVIGHIINCRKNSFWCKVEVEGYRGFIQRNEVWGVHNVEGVAG